MSTTTGTEPSDDGDDLDSSGDPAGDSASEGDSTDGPASGETGDSVSGDASGDSETDSSSSTGSSAGSGSSTDTASSSASSTGSGTSNQVCTSYSFSQPTQSEPYPLDILFVADTSASMSDDLEKIASNLNAFVDELTDVDDFRIALMPAQIGTKTYVGKLYSSGGVGPVLDSDAYDTTDEMGNDLGALFTAASGDNNAKGGEAGQYSVQEGVTDNLATNRGNSSDPATQTFFRSDAVLAVIFVSDEQDYCYEYADHAFPNSSEFDSHKTWCHGTSKEYGQDLVVTNQTVFDNILSMQGDRPFSLSGVFYSTTPQGTTSQESIGYGYKELVEGYGGGSQGLPGITIDLNDVAADTTGTAMADGLAEVAALANRQVSFIKEVSLPATTDASSLSISVDGTAISSSQYSYDSSDGLLTLTSYGSAGSAVTVNYCYAP